MRPDPVWRRYTRFWGTNVDADIDDEMRFHLESRVEELEQSSAEQPTETTP
jgi:hypothetical protein